MSTLHADQRTRAQRALNTQHALFRNELRRVTDERTGALARADIATRRIEQLLPGAVQAGLTIVEIAQLTRISRPTIYRMLSEARRVHDVRSDAQELEDVLERTAHDLGHPPLPHDLAKTLQISVEEVQAMLGEAFGYLAGELQALGPAGLTALVDLLPQLGKPEKIVLNMLLLQRMPVDDVARATQFSSTEVLAWAGLGLLRVLPDLRQRSSSP